MSPHLHSDPILRQLLSPLYALSCIRLFILYSFVHRAFLRLLRVVHRLPTNPQNQNPPSLRSQTRSSESQSRRQPLCTSRTTSIPSNTQKLLKLPPSVCPIAVFVPQRLTVFTWASATMWPYSGKRYSHNLPVQPPTTQQHSPHLAPPVPPPMPPPSYEEDSAQQAAQSRSYVYAYPQYYPGQVRSHSKDRDHSLSVLIPSQPMMPGMAPPPPGTYMPSPYMHPMHYPHTMPPPNGESMAHRLPGHFSRSRPAMYPSPNMNQMPRKYLRNPRNYTSDLAISSWTLHGPPSTPRHIPTAT